MTTRLTFLLLLAFLFVVTLANTQNASSRSASIVNRNDKSGMLGRYYELSALPINESKTLFRNASSNDKSELWRTHLALFLVKDQGLNEQQKKVIRAAMSLATPEFFEVRPSDPAWKAKVQEPLHSLEEQIVSVFSRDDATKIFATLRDNIEPAICGATYAQPVLLNSINYKPLTEFGSYLPWAHNRFGGQEKDKGSGGEKRGAPCQCSTDSDWCPLSGYCSGTGCTPTQSGCGTLWSYPCNGASCR